MPTLDWLDREHTFRIAARVPTRVLRLHAAAPATVGNAAAAQGDPQQIDATISPKG